MYCIVRARTYDQDVETRVEFAMFEVTEDLLRRIEGYAGQLAGISPEPAFMEFWDYTPAFLDWPDLDDEHLYEEVERMLEREVGDTYRFFPELPKALTDWAEKRELTVDTVRLCFSGRSPGEFFWEGYLKHTAIVFSTDPMRLEDLKRAFAEREPRLHDASGIQLKLWEPASGRLEATEGINLGPPDEED